MEGVVVVVVGVDESVLGASVQLGEAVVCLAVVGGGVVVVVVGEIVGSEGLSSGVEGLRNLHQHSHPHCEQLWVDVVRL